MDMTVKGSNPSKILTLDDQLESSYSQSLYSWWLWHSCAT